MSLSLKKVKFILLTTILILALGTSSIIYGYSTTNNVVLQFTIFNTGFVSVTNIGAAEVDAGSIVANTTNVYQGSSVRGIFKNNGTGQEDFSLRAEVIQGGVTLVSSTPASNQVRLFVIFGQWDKTYSKTDFASDDVITTSYQAADADRFAVSSDSASVKGYDVPSAGERSILFCINPGKTTSDPQGNKVKIKIWVKAQAG